MRPFFEGLKVIELSSVLAGPAVGMFFAELGAKVLKIENKKSGGDVTRSWKLVSEDANHPFSAYYSSVNYGKQSIFLNLNEANDFNLLKSELQTADIVICNFKKGDASKFKLDFDSIKEINSSIIYGEITGFGDSDRIAYDVVLQAETGFISMTGTENGELCKLPVAFIDLFAAHQLKQGILIALLQQSKKVEALKVSVSLYDAALAALANQASNWLMAGIIPKPMGTLHPNIAPYGELFTCKDEGKIILAIGSDGQFKKLCDLLKVAHLAGDEAYHTNQQRVKNRIALKEQLQNEFIHFDSEELLNQLIDAKVPAGKVRNVKEVFETNQAKAKILREQKENHELISVSGNAFKISSS